MLCSTETNNYANFLYRVCRRRRMAFPSAPDDYAIFFNHIRGEGAGWLPSRMVSCPSLLNITPLSEQRYHGGVFFNPRIRWIIGRRILGFGAGILGFGAGILGFRQSQDSMCSPLTNPRIRKSQDSPASNPRIFRILGFDVTDPPNSEHFLTGFERLKFQK